MPSLRDFVGQDLNWVRPRLLQSNYELHAGDQCLATLSRSGILGKVTLAKAEDQQWEFKREYHWKVRLVIYANETGANDKSRQPLATIKRKWNGHGELIFSDGHAYSWSHIKISFWNRVWSLTSPEGTLLSMKKKRLLQIAPAASNLPDLPLLVLFSFYLMLIMEEEEAAASGG